MIKLMTSKKFKKHLEDAKKEGTWEFIELMRQKDKIYLGGVTFKGSGNKIENCVVVPSRDTKCGIYIEKN